MVEGQGLAAMGVYFAGRGWDGLGFPYLSLLQCVSHWVDSVSSYIGKTKIGELIFQELFTSVHSSC